ncbi:MAG: 50S ribosomal protein L35 [Ignavibacteriae bacterium]|nr:50S ribosomal protein L35 [Ignavibacteriota bacterium]MCB0724944.1 50S ribosomal protein L35 [Ignavibacteriota bacterium]MCB9242043.1 50S ribosomal protein L35 [Ignavibacteriales bacterium]
MPKMKSNRGASKRFKVTANGKVKRHKAYANHILTKKSPGRKRKLRAAAMVTEADANRVKRMLLAE